MSDIRFDCSKCGQHLEAGADMAGETIHCPKCTIELVIPQPDPIISSGSTSITRPSVQSPRLEPELIIKKPNLFWRRIASVLVDLVFLHILVFAGSEITGTNLVGAILAWTAFFGIWFTLHLKFGLSIGKLLLNIRTAKIDMLGESSPLFLGRFALTWFPLLIMLLPDYDPALLSSGGTSAVIQLFQVLVWIWYLCIFVSLIVTKGRRGLHDIIVKCVTDFIKPQCLSLPRKITASLAAVALVCEMAFIMLMDSSADPTLSAVHSDTGTTVYDVNARYNPEQIRGFYQDRVFEVETRWQQPGGFLWLDTVWEGGNGSALMFLNTRKYGLLASNWHVVEPSSSITGEYGCRVRRNPKEDFAEGLVVAKGKYDLDLSLILIELGEGWDPGIVPISTIAELKQGEDAVAIGNALGRGISVTDGLVSMVEGNVGAQSIRISTPISPGNSGGPLFLRRGALFAGIVTAQDTTDHAQNVNYAVPAEYLWNPNNWEFFVDDPSFIIAMLQGMID